MVTEVWYFHFLIMLFCSHEFVTMEIHGSVLLMNDEFIHICYSSPALSIWIFFLGIYLFLGFMTYPRIFHYYYK